MTARQLIRALEKIDRKYPRRQVCVDLESRNKNMDSDWTHRCIDEAVAQTIEKTDDDGGILYNSKNEGVTMSVISLRIN